MCGISGFPAEPVLSAPVGREGEWERLLARLNAREPALVLIAGPPGIGRTTLLTAVASAGRELGYSVIGGQDAVPMDQTTRPSDLQRIVASVLGVTATAPAKSEPTSRGFGRRLADLFGLASSENAILSMLKARAPAILAIDGYAPSRVMSRWFTDKLIPGVLRSGAPILVLIADQIESMAPLRGAATDVIKLQPVSREAVEAHLRAAGHGLQPPLSDGELAAYCDAVENDLSLLTPLHEVLSVLGPEA